MNTSMIMSICEEHNNELLNAQNHIWTHIFNYLHSMALKCAIKLKIPDTIHNHGKPMTLSELATALALHPTKTASLYRLTRLLVHSNFLSKSKLLINGQETFDLTLNSELLLQDHPMTLAPFALAMLDPTITEPAHHLGSWFRNDDVSPFHTLHGVGIWEYAGTEPRFNEYFNQAMMSDAEFVNRILMMGDHHNEEFKSLFDGVRSLVDVGGGTGTLAKAIAKGYPNVKCSVLDLPHVIQGLRKNKLDCLEYVQGDMFESIPFANVLLLKWIMHDWSDEDCVKILNRCKEAIPSKEEGGKVIIIDHVVMNNNVDDDEIHNAQLLFDMKMLSETIGRKERTEEEWKQLLMKTGYDDYKILNILGSRSIIVAYPS